MAKELSPIAKKNRAAKRKKFWTRASIVVVCALVLFIGGWYGLHAIGVADYTPLEVLTGKDGPYCEIGDYKNLTYTDMSLDITDEDYDNYYKTMLEENPNYVKDASRAGSEVKKGDILNIDFDGKLNGVSFTGGSAKGTYITIGSEKFIPGFEDALIGKEIGKTCDIDVTFPDTYAVDSTLAGKDVVFTVTINYAVNEVKGVTDDYIASQTDYKTKSEYEEKYLTAYLKDARVKYVKSIQNNEIITQIVDNTKFYNVDKEIASNYDNVIGYYSQQAQAYGMNLENFVSVSEGLGISEFKAEIRKTAETNVKKRMALEKIAKKEGLKVNDKIYEQYIEQAMTENNFTDRKAFESEFTKDGIKDLILNIYTLDKVVSYAKAK